LLSSKPAASGGAANHHGEEGAPKVNAVGTGVFLCAVVGFSKFCYDSVQERALSESQQSSQKHEIQDDINIEVPTGSQAREQQRADLEKAAHSFHLKLARKDEARAADFEQKHEANAAALRRKLERVDEGSERFAERSARLEADAAVLRQKLAAKDASRAEEFSTRVEASAAALREKLQ
jgi:hypothetical protein